MEGKQDPKLKKKKGQELLLWSVGENKDGDSIKAVAVGKNNTKWEDSEDHIQYSDCGWHC